MIPKACDATTPYYADARAIAAELRCPVCEGQRVQSSAAPFALQVKQDICDHLRAGIPREAVTQRILQDYGADLRTVSGESMALWPLSLTLLGLALASAVLLRRHLKP